MKFRADINGMRAIAVILVVLFHFNAKLIPAGFIGVDIFFVISGYLMTSIITNKLKNNDFSIVGFYSDRAMRIVPALIFLCAILLFLGWFTLPPTDYKSLGKHAASSAGFLSNVIYFKESGYFDPDSHNKWLLHTWSLSVEWQFYVIYPLLLAFLSKLTNLKNLSYVIVALLFVGVFWNVIESYSSPSAAYFLIYSRAWEMLLGGVAFLFPFYLSKNKSHFCEYLGLFLIVTSCFVFSEKSSWPSYNALFPVFGAYLILIANNQTSMFTCNRVFQQIGKISYSLYLWHWPVLITFYFFQFSFNAISIVLGVFISVLLAILSYFLVERKITAFLRKKYSSNNNLAGMVLFVILIGLVGSYIFIEKGIPSRVDGEVRIADFEARNKNLFADGCAAGWGEENWFPLCVFKNSQQIESNTISLILIGDSYAAAVITAVADVTSEQKRGGTALFFKHGCWSMPGFIRSDGGNSSRECFDYSSALFDLLTEDRYKKVPVLIVNRLQYFPQEQESKLEDKEQMYFYPKSIENKVDENNFDFVINEAAQLYYDNVCKLAIDRDVFVLMPIPEMSVNVPKYMSRKLMNDANVNLKISKEVSIYQKRHKNVIKVLNKVKSDCNVTLLDPTKYLCDEKQCNGEVNGRPLYFDSNHLSDFGNRKLKPLFEKIWN